MHYSKKLCGSVLEGSLCGLQVELTWQTYFYRSCTSLWDQSLHSRTRQIFY